jgi:hypothetical protein
MFLGLLHKVSDKIMQLTRCSIEYYILILALNCNGNFMIRRRGGRISFSPCSRPTKWTKLLMYRLDQIDDTTIPPKN